MPFNSTNSRLSFAGSLGRAIDAVEIVSLRASIIGNLETVSSIFEISVGEKSFVEVTSRSAVINARASLPTTLVKFCISERSATTDPTPNAMQRKKKSSRCHDERISRRVKLSIKSILFHRRDAETQS